MITPALADSGLPPPASPVWRCSRGWKCQESPPETPACFYFLLWSQNKRALGGPWWFPLNDDSRFPRKHQLIKQHHSSDNNSSECWNMSKQRKNSHLICLNQRKLKGNSKEDKMNVRNDMRSREKRREKDWKPFCNLSIPGVDNTAKRVCCEETAGRRHKAGETKRERGTGR